MTGGSTITPATNGKPAFVSGGESVIGLSVLMVVYSLCRVAHTVCYLNALQPWRSVSCYLAILCAFCASGILIGTAVNVDFTSMYA